MLCVVTWKVVEDTAFCLVGVLPLAHFTPSSFWSFKWSLPISRALKWFGVIPEFEDFILIHKKIFKIDWGKELAWSNLFQLPVLFCSGSIRWALVKESPWVISCGCQGFCFTVLQKILVTRSLLTLNPCQETGMELERTPTIGEACIVQSGPTD